jgi:IS5 family transposase
MKRGLNDLSAAGSLFTSVRWPKSRLPRRAEVLYVLEQAIPWQKLENMARPHYFADARVTGRPGYSLRMMLRAWVVQFFWSLSDDGLEAAILDSHATARFIGTDPWQPRPPSSTKIRAFRRLLEDRRLRDQFELAIEVAFADAGLQFRTGEIREPVFRGYPKRGAVQHDET